VPAAIAAAGNWIAATVITATGHVAWTSSVAFVAISSASQLAINAALYYGLDALTRPEATGLQGGELFTNIAANGPRQMVVGQRLLGGQEINRFSRGSNLSDALFVVQLADHPITELSKVYADGAVVLDAPLVHGVRTAVPAYNNPDEGDRLWITFYDGRPGQTADAHLVAASEEDPFVVAGEIEPWTTDHVGAGCAYIILEMVWDPDILTQRPNIQCLVKGAPLYDRRLDDTAGGSGDHRYDDPSTWEYSANAAVALDHYLLGYAVEDDPLAFGVGLRKSEVPYAVFAHAADLADEDVETGTGGDVETIKRYEVNAVVGSELYYEQVIETMQLQMAARVVDLGGRIGILGAEERASVVDLTDDDWATDESVAFSDKLAFSELIGAVNGSFADPANLYEMTPYDGDTLTTPYAALPDGGEAQTQQLDLPFETHPRRAVRLASAYLQRESLQPRLGGTMMARAWPLEPGDWFTFSSTRLQIEDELFEVIDIVKNADFTVTLTARAISADFLAFDNDNDPDLSVPPEVSPVSLFLDVPEFDVDVTTLVAGGVVEPALEVTLTTDETVAREIVLEYGKADPAWDEVDPAEAILGATYVDSFHTSQIFTKLRKSILPSTAYRVRAKSKAGHRESPWSDWSAPETTGATYSVGSAASVPWSGVSDDDGHRPDADADVTGSHTAAAITGQGTLATLNSAAWGNQVSGRPTNLSALAGTEDIRNALLQVAGFNNVRYSALEAGGVVGFALQDTSWGASSFAIARTTSSPASTVEPAVLFSASAGVNGVTNYGSFGSNLSSTVYMLAVKSGDRVQMSARVRSMSGGILTANGGALNMTVARANTAGTIVAIDSLSGAGTNTAVALGAAGRLGGFYTAPADGWVAIDLYATKASAYTGSFAAVIDQFFISIARADQTAVDPYTAGPSNEPGSDITGTHTAASIVGQGALALLNSLANGGAYLSGFGALSALATINSSALLDAGVVIYTALASTAVRLGTNITRNDGTTSLTDALAVTSLGTAAAIASQGTFATLSAINSTLADANNLLRKTSGGLFTGELAADVTVTHTAAAITGQGGLATINFITIGTNIRLADGTTVATTAMVVTASGTAAAIASQGALATLNAAAWASQVSGRPANLSSLAGTEGILNSILQVAGVNNCRWSRLEKGDTTGWQLLDTGWGATGLAIARTTSSPATAADPALLFSASAGAGATFNYGACGQQYTTSSYLLPVKAGDRVQISARARSLSGGILTANAGNLVMVALQCDTAGVGVTQLGVTAASNSSNGLGAAGRLGGFATASIDGFIAIDIYAQKANAYTGAFSVVLDQFFLSLARSDQTALDPYTPGPDGFIAADVTGSNVAASVSGQGNMATGNSYYQSSDPGGNNGDFWGDTTNGLLKYKTGGAWAVIGDLGGVLKVTVGAAVNVVGSSGFSGDITVTPTGGDGTYTYLWTKMPYEAGAGSTVLTNTTTATVHLAATLSTGQDSTGRVQCVVKDGKGRTATISQSYNFSKTS